ncbi:Xylose isomerase-like TIM barrel domain-containing protein [Plasmodiophora brassicae]|uniref:Xylose isomerase-like TIM barrel domain-containing protein n=1 Tax=Plasmodiophora brassicae TaxID=37360 RepID=A0A3P3YLY6_PLABS|nr:unnamed protein product [Plasmodiophora brassicae]
MTRPSLTLFRTLWGVVRDDAGWKTLQDTLVDIKAQGFQGVECSVKLAYTVKGFVEYMRELDLLWAPIVFSSGPIDGCDPFIDGDLRAGPGSSWKTQLSAWQNQISRVERLGLPPSKITLINSFSGHDAMEHADAVSLLKAMQDWFKSSSLGQSRARLLHETHRGRILYSPWVARRIVRDVPEIGLVADFSHWTCVAERNPPAADISAAASNNDDIGRDMLHEAILNIIPNVYHVQGRVGYDQGPQVSDPRLEVWQPHLAGFEYWWHLIFKNQLESGRTQVFTFAPEHGPPPYQQGEPDDDLLRKVDSINVWLANRQRLAFNNLVDNC